MFLRTDSTHFLHLKEVVSYRLFTSENFMIFEVKMSVDKIGGEKVWVTSLGDHTPLDRNYKNKEVY